MRVWLSIFAFLVLASSALATEPEIIFTWKADSFVPTHYQLKTLPTHDTKIGVNIVLLDQEKIINLSEKEIIWKLYNEKLNSGKGLTNISFKNPGTFRSSYNVSVKILDYNEDGHLSGFLQIPIIKPKIVVETFQKDSINTLTLWPYFFNILSLEELNIDWLINNISINPIPSSQVQISDSEENSSAILNIDVRAEKKENTLESARALFSL